MFMIKKIFLSISLFISFSLLAGAEAILLQDKEVFEKAKVVEVISKGTSSLPGGVPVETQMVRAEVLTGESRGKVVTIENDYVQLSEGDTFYIRHQTNEFSEADNWSVSDPYRLPLLFSLAFIFVLLVFVFGGRQGVRGLASLVGSFVLIFYLLIPGIYNGYNAIFVSIGVSSLIIVLGSYITHGASRTTSSAVIGMIVTILFTGVASYFVVLMAKLSGYTSDESVFLHLNSGGSIDMVGLLFGGIMIGLLGVLYDSAIGQAVAVEELCAVGKHLSRKEIYKRALRMGREHIGALVNTLAIAYIGAALPLFLLLYTSTTGILFIINSELIATEIIRILVGSIGLVLAVPITTLIASYMLYGRVKELGKDGERNGAHGHSHSHGRSH